MREVKWCSRRILLVAIVWLWMFIGSIMVTILIAYIKNIPVRGSPFTFKQFIDIYGDEPYLAVYAEVAGVGGLPLLVSIMCNDSFAVYGFRRRGMLRSIVLSLMFVVVMLSLRVLQRGWPSPEMFSSFNLKPPLSIWYAVLGVLAYGPLEVFFVVWLIVNTDRAINIRGRIVSPGLIITVIIFGVSHMVFAGGGAPSAISVAIAFLVLGVIFNHTGNITGPIIAWTLVNRQILYLLVGCLT